MNLYTEEARAMSDTNLHLTSGSKARNGSSQPTRWTCRPTEHAGVEILTNGVTEYRVWAGDGEILAVRLNAHVATAAELINAIDRAAAWEDAVRDG